MVTKHGYACSITAAVFQEYVILNGNKTIRLRHHRGEIFQEYVILNGNKTTQQEHESKEKFQEYVILNGNKTFKGIQRFKVPVHLDGAFKQMFVSDYESNNADELAEWVYDNCLDVVNPVKVKEKAENYQK